MLLNTQAWKYTSVIDMDSMSFYQPDPNQWLNAFDVAKGLAPNISTRAAQYYNAYLFMDVTDCTGSQELSHEYVNKCYSDPNGWKSVGFQAANGPISVLAWPHHDCTKGGAVGVAVPAGQERCLNRVSGNKVQPLYSRLVDPA